MRATQGDRVFFRIPEDVLKPDGLKRKKRLEKYNDYKSSLYELAKLNKFDMPPNGLCISFFIPIPKTWKKWKKKLMHFKPHQQKPDLSNLLKAFEDSLVTDDSFIYHYGGLAKYWVDFEVGWIELTYNEEEVATKEMPIK